MGITISVGSIMRPESEFEPLTNYGIDPSILVERQQQIIKGICQAFNLSKVPWNDPSPRKSSVVDGNFSIGKYEFLRKLASGDYVPTENSLLEIPFGALPEEARHEWYQPSPFIFFSKEDRFEWYRHFLDADYSRPIYYLPSDFQPPKHLKISSNSNGDITICSSIQLKREMEDLMQELSYYRRRYGEETPFNPSTRPGRTISWKDLYSFCNMLYIACFQSIQFTLPIFVCY